MFLWALMFPALLALGVIGACPPKDSIDPCTCKLVTDTFGRAFSIMTCLDIRTEDTLVRVVEATRGHALFELELVNAALSYIPQDTFEGTTLTFLSIKNSSIRALSDTDVAFKGLDDSLVMIEVVNSSFVSNWDWSQLTRLKLMQEILVEDSDVLDLANGLSTLQHLYFKAFIFTGDNIQLLDNGIFAPFEFLERISLDRNYIAKIERSMFPRPANRLQLISLSNNKLTSLPMDLFVDMPAITSVYLTGNPLRTIDETVFRPVWQQIHAFFFNNTKLSCDCRLSWMKQLDNKGKFIHAECQSPEHVKGKQVQSVQMHELWCFHR